jgi:hypothetical protein
MKSVIMYGALGRKSSQTGANPALQIQCVCRTIRLLTTIGIVAKPRFQTKNA